VHEFVERLITKAPSLLGDLSHHVKDFDSFLKSNLGSIPPAMIYFAVLLIAVIGLIYLTKMALKLAFFVILPTIGSAIAVSYAFPSLDPAKILPGAAIVFVAIFIFKH
jgi:hypothetical protein